MLVEVVPGETRIKKGEGSGGGTEDLTSTSPAPHKHLTSTLPAPHLGLVGIGVGEVGACPVFLPIRP